MEKKCPLCGSNDIRFLVKPYRGGSIYVCDRCGNAATDPLPVVSYLRDAFFDLPADELNTYMTYAGQIMDFIYKHVRQGSLLDVGTGAGFLVEEAQKRGFAATGIDPSGPAVSFCRKRKLEVYQGYFEKYDFKNRMFRIITCSHVLEHVNNPEKFIAKIKKILDKNGYLFLVQTNFQGTIPHLLGRFWEGWVPQEHRFHFSPKGIRNFLAKNGLKVKALEIIPLGYKPVWRKGNWGVAKGNLYNIVNYLISRFRIGFPFEADQMYVLAERQ